MSWVSVALFVYVGLQVALSSYVARKVRTESDYLVAGRNVGVGLLSVSLFATWFGAETVIGASGAVANGGLADGRADPFGYMICLVLMALFLAAQMRSRNYVTLGDFFRDRFGSKAEKLAVLVMVPTSLMWASAQILAFAAVLTAVTAIPVQTSLVLTTVILIVYSSLGGMIGDIVTDTIEACVIVIGLLTMLFVVVARAGGWGEAFAAIDPQRLSLVSPDENFWAQIDGWAVPILGSLVAQEAVSRPLAAKSPQVARKACLIGAGLYLIVGTIPLLIGLVGNKLVPTPEESDDFLMTLAQHVLDPVFYVLLMGALISAILSTINSTLLAVTGLVGHNLVVPLLPGASDRKKLLIDKGIVAISGIVCYFLAVSGDSIYELVELASSFGSAGIMVCVLIGLNSRFGSGRVALLTLIAGVVLTIIFNHAIDIPMPYITSVVLCLIIYGAAGLFEQRSTRHVSP